jgi:ParB-like chromosome segregation protein Spo0J
MSKIKLSKIKPNPNNPRIIKDDKFKKLVQSLQEFPEMMEKRPLVCVTDVDGSIYPLGGNMRLKALQELKLKEIPSTYVMMADEWTEERRREFVIKDNIGYGEWEWEQLANDWDTEQLQDWGLDIPDFKQIEESEADDLSDKIKSEYRIEVICRDEAEQEQTYNKLIEQNYECRLLTL